MRIVTLAIAVFLFTATPSPAAPWTTEEQQPTPPSTPALEALQAGIDRILAGDPAAARAHFQRALELARIERNRLLEGAAHRGLATAFMNQARLPIAKTEFEAALAIFEQL